MYVGGYQPEKPIGHFTQVMSTFAKRSKHQPPTIFLGRVFNV